LHPDLESLLALQEKDRAVQAVQKQLELLLPEEAALDQELGSHRKSVDDAQRAHANAEARRAELEQRIANYKGVQERRRQQLDFVRGAKEASTLMAEIDLARGVLVKEEAEFLKSGDAITDAERKLKDAQKVHDAAWGTQADARQAIADKRAVLQEQLDAAKRERAESAKHVKAPLLARYERIRRGRSPAVVYPVRSDACGHCMTAVPLQRRMIIQHAQSIESCEMCGVLLYAEG
jgi:hypothetical protein